MTFQNKQEKMKMSQPCSKHEKNILSIWNNKYKIPVPVFWWFVGRAMTFQWAWTLVCFKNITWDAKCRMDHYKNRNNILTVLMRTWAGILTISVSTVQGIIWPFSSDNLDVITLNSSPNALFMHKIFFKLMN